MKLQAKILLGYAASLTLVVLVGLWGVFNLRLLGQASENILQDNYRSIRAADGMIDALERQDSATLILLLNDVKSGRSLFQENEILFLPSVRNRLSEYGSEVLFRSDYSL